MSLSQKELNYLLIFERTDDEGSFDPRVYKKIQENKGNKATYDEMVELGYIEAEPRDYQIKGTPLTRKLYFLTTEGLAAKDTLSKRKYENK